MRLPRLVHNPLSYAGATIAVLASLAFLFLLIFHTVTHTIRAPYAGLVIFILTPAILLSGLLLIPLGMLFEWRHWRRTGVRSIPPLPLIDLNKPSHRNAAFVFVAGSIVLLFLTGFGSYETYEYTESVPFCGALCHTSCTRSTRPTGAPPTRAWRASTATWARAPTGSSSPSCPGRWLP